MDIGSIFLFLAIILPVGLFISRPFFETARKSLPENPDRIDHTRSGLLAEKDRILNALSELDFDYNLGKIPPEDYQIQRMQLLEKGADVLQKLDAIEDSTNSRIVVDMVEPATSDGEIERKSGEFQKTPNPSAVRRAALTTTLRNGSPDDKIEALLANRRRQRQEKATGFCHKCGGTLHRSDRFCPKCGADILLK